MTLTVYNSDHLVGMTVEGFVQNGHQDSENGLLRIQKLYEIAASQIREAEESEELTPLGKREAIKRALDKAHGALEPHEKDVERLAATVASTRAKALERKSTERTPDAIAMEREIRDRLMAEKADPLLIDVQYYSALGRGDDVFVRAVENAPASFPLISPDARQRGQEHRLAESPLAADLEQQESTHQVFKITVATTRNELGKLAERFQVDMPAVTASAS